MTPIYTGLIGGHQPATAPVCSVNAPAHVPGPGTYTTSCHGAADVDYTFTYVTGADTVNAAPAPKPAPAAVPVSSASANLPYTGSDGTREATAGLALVALGAALTVAARRRQRA